MLRRLEIWRIFPIAVSSGASASAAISLLSRASLGVIIFTASSRRLASLFTAGLSLVLVGLMPHWRLYLATCLAGQSLRCSCMSFRLSARTTMNSQAETGGCPSALQWLCFYRTYASSGYIRSSVLSCRTCR
ncbi:uncharacterized protein MYCFIDRAFT_210675 [Pseudocercospora fijiensis CIRAD86]|uniref:Uncharacterized protein n=1 Tax=Pseudocercospora fijiensis (strain CIRAD86) TaxID=383855 RepID=M3AQY4_PSEFD|nr:uncharacterized protein MYCFIDRAFT_210675 [Pseudocercospora fijiensis CIRAD86]EME87036.1 hypothetical protein MYCFIDRAFT_210675 [Pseudocercospora fijiensis CIRAD86]